MLLDAVQQRGDAGAEKVRITVRKKPDGQLQMQFLTHMYHLRSMML